MRDDKDLRQYLSKLTDNDFYSEYQYDSIDPIDPRLLENLHVYNFISNSYKQTGPQSLITVVELAVSEGIITMEQGEGIWSMLVKLARTKV